MKYKFSGGFWKTKFITKHANRFVQQSVIGKNLNFVKQRRKIRLIEVGEETRGKSWTVLEKLKENKSFYIVSIKNVCKNLKKSIVYLK